MRLVWDRKTESGKKPRIGQKRGYFVPVKILDRPKTGLIRGQTESGKSQTAVLAKEARSPSFGDRGWTSPYILFKYPHIPVCTDAPARVRQYAFSMATVCVFDGELLPTPIRRARAGVRDHAYTSTPPPIPNVRGSGPRDL